jgi:signal transduction histidine kinase
MVRRSGDGAVRREADDESARTREDFGMGAVREPRIGRIPSRIKDALDVAFALAVFFVLTGGLFFWGQRGSHVVRHHPSPAAYPVVALAALPLAVRRRYPGPVLACAVVATFVSGAVPHMQQVTTPALAIALITFAVREPLRQTIAAAVVSYGALLGQAGLRGTHLASGDVVSRLFLVAAMSALGLYIRTRRAYVDQLRERARDLEREQELRAERAVGEERVRIARDLHDAVAHHVSLLVVEAGAIRESLPADSPARPVADSMAATGRQALAEMRDMLGVLRTADGAAERAPQPAVADIGALVEQTRSAGVDTELVVEGEKRELPVGVELAAYRIVQESLTNVVKHAGPAHARIEIRYEPDALELRVIDDGRGAAQSSDGGHGIVGMRERVAVYGGELAAAPRNGRGWEVRARLPLGVA